MNSKNALIASAVAMLLVTGVVGARAQEGMGTDQVKCVGANSCKGQSSCKSAQNDCKGKNACKGQGFVKTTAQDCKDKGGTPAPSDGK
jgi:hypothetical protein